MLTWPTAVGDGGAFSTMPNVSLYLGFDQGGDGSLIGDT
jgi:hypothetical protein